MEETTQEVKARQPKVEPEKVRQPKVPIIIPGAEHMTPEELKKAKHNEKMRRYMLRKRSEGLADPGATKKTAQELRILSNQELVDLSSESRDLILQAVNEKLKLVLSDPEQLAKINLVSLTTAFGTMFDKTQLMKGLSTDNIAIHHKIDINMTSDKALEELNKMREQYAAGNQ